MASCPKPYNPVVEWWVTWWTDLLTCKDRQAFRRILAEIDRLQVGEDELEKMRKWEAESEQDAGEQPPKLTKADFRRLSAMLFSSTVAREIREGRDADLQARRLIIEGMRALNDRARRSIRYFRERSQKANGVGEHKSFERKMLRLARERAKLFQAAARKAANASLNRSYIDVANESEQRCQKGLSRIRKGDWRGGTSDLRQLFFEKSRAHETLTAYPRLHRQAFPALGVELAYFNWASYFKFVKKKRDAYRLADSLALASGLTEVRDPIGRGDACSADAPHGHVRVTRFLKRHAPHLLPAYR